MVFLDLVIRAITENIKELRVDPSTFTWHFTIECNHCHIEHSNEIYFTQNDEVEMQKGHGTANFFMKCKECQRPIYIEINKKSPFNLQCETGNDEGVLAIFECRGGVLKKWIPREGIIIEAIDSGTNFEDVEVSDIWCEFDEATNNMVNFLEPIQWRLEENKSRK
jgi:hypothetical protein